MFIEKRLSNAINCARVVAMFFVIAAHVSVSNVYIDRFFSVIGAMGVGIFMFMSGYLFNNDKRFLEFFGKKLKSLVLPWFVGAVVVFLYTAVVQHSSITLQAMLMWFLGYKTYLYFLTVLMVFFVLFYKVKNKYLLYGCAILNLISVFLTQAGYLDNVINAIGITNYLNPFNFIGFFAMGMLIRKYDSEKFYNVLHKCRYFSPVILIVIILILFITQKTGYVHLLPHILEYGVIFSVLSMTTFIGNIDISKISKYSFTTYLYHMPFVGILARIYNLNAITMALAPIVIYLVVNLILWIADFISEKMKLDRLYKIVMGVR